FMPWIISRDDATLTPPEPPRVPGPRASLKTPPHIRFAFLTTTLHASGVRPTRKTSYACISHKNNLKLHKGPRYSPRLRHSPRLRRASLHPRQQVLIPTGKPRED